MNRRFGLLSSVKKAFAALASAKSPRLFARLLHDEAGYYLVSMTLIFPVLVGIVGFGTEGGLLLYNLQRLQSAADAAAFSAATAYGLNSSINPSTQAKAITATYGFVDGTSNVTVTVNTGAQIKVPSC